MIVRLHSAEEIDNHYENLRIRLVGHTKKLKEDKVLSESEYYRRIVRITDLCNHIRRVQRERLTMARLRG
jgi:hypothetical protein